MKIKAHVLREGMKVRWHRAVGEKTASDGQTCDVKKSALKGRIILEIVLGRAKGCYRQVIETPQGSTMSAR